MFPALGGNGFGDGKDQLRSVDAINELQIQVLQQSLRMNELLEIVAQQSAYLNEQFKESNETQIELTDIEDF